MPGLGGVPTSGMKRGIGGGSNIPGHRDYVAPKKKTTTYVAPKFDPAQYGISQPTNNTGGTTPGTTPGTAPGGPSPGTVPSGGPSASQLALENITNMPPGMTPEQMQLMRNRISDTHASQRQGSEERLRTQMQRSGLSGTGQETRGLLSNEQGNMASLQNALTGTDLANMQLENQNRMQLAGLGVQAAGGVDRNLFNQAQLAQQGNQFGQNFGYQQYLNEINQRQYEQQQQQYNDWLSSLTNGGSSGIRRPGPGLG